MYVCMYVCYMYVIWKMMDILRTVSQLLFLSKIQIRNNLQQSDYYSKLHTIKCISIIPTEAKCAECREFKISALPIFCSDI